MLTKMCLIGNCQKSLSLAFLEVNQQASNHHHNHSDGKSSNWQNWEWLRQHYDVVFYVKWKHKWVMVNYGKVYHRVDVILLDCEKNVGRIANAIIVQVCPIIIAPVVAFLSLVKIKKHIFAFFGTNC